MEPRATPKAPSSRRLALWLLAAAALGAALSALVVASLFVRSDRGRHERGTVETSTAVPRAPAPDAATTTVEHPGAPAPEMADTTMASRREQADASAEQATALDAGAEPPVAAARPISEGGEGGGVVAPSAVDAGPPREELAAGTNPFAPSMAAGAGAFTTEAPPYAASSMTANLDAGAGAFTTEAPSYAASSMTESTNVGAGSFTTERNVGPITGGPVVIGIVPLIPPAALTPSPPPVGATGTMPSGAGIPAASMPVAEPLRPSPFPTPPSLYATAPTFGPMFGAPSPAGWPTTR